jgi:hypothetical protein
MTVMMATELSALVVAGVLKRRLMKSIPKSAKRSSRLKEKPSTLKSKELSIQNTP